MDEIKLTREALHFVVGYTDYETITRVCYGREIPWDGTAQTCLLWIVALLDAHKDSNEYPKYVHDQIKELLAQLRFQVPKVYGSTEG